MSHVRTQIRERFKAVLTATLDPAKYRVFASRKFAINSDRGVATVDMTFQNVNVEQQTMGDKRLHTASLYIRVQRGQAETSMDDSLDADEVAITQIIEAQDWSDLLEEDPELMQVNFTSDTEGSTAIGAIILRYDLEYRIDKTNPQIVVR